MIESLLIVAGGLLGSGHCIGMCGGFALTLGSTAENPWRISCANACMLSGVSPFTSSPAPSSALEAGSSAAAVWALSMSRQSCRLSPGCFLLGRAFSRRAWSPRHLRLRAAVPASTYSPSCFGHQTCRACSSAEWSMACCRAVLSTPTWCSQRVPAIFLQCRRHGTVRPWHLARIDRDGNDRFVAGLLW